MHNRAHRSSRGLGDMTKSNLLRRCRSGKQCRLVTEIHLHVCLRSNVPWASSAKTRRKTSYHFLRSTLGTCDTPLTPLRQQMLSDGFANSSARLTLKLLRRSHSNIAFKTFFVIASQGKCWKILRVGSDDSNF